MNAFRINSTSSILLLGAVLLPISMATGGSAFLSPELQTAARRAISPDSKQSEPAVATLRDAGPSGLDAMFVVHERLFDQHTVDNPFPGLKKTDPEWIRLKAAIDRIGAQRDCNTSHLYWFTDFDRAKAEARTSGKPILSLRLLGNLDEEYSCANSRFFRTTLYANAEVSRYLRDNFILHWQSVRPVPRITIDFGDGRRIERTITGNSIHYVLDSDGNPIDALPGLYSPREFITGLTRAVSALRSFVELPAPDREARLWEYHQQRLASIENQWRNDLLEVGQPVPAVPVVRILAGGSSSRPTATAAMPLAVGKAAVESPMLRQVQPDTGNDRGSLEKRTDDATWKKIAALRSEENLLDDSSRRLIRAKSLTAAEASRLAFSKMRIEDPMIRMIDNLERSIAEDTVRNEYLFHSRIHEWFANGTAPANVDELNAKVYAELFLTPDSDPWLGLAPSDVFSALDNGGLIKPELKH